MRNLLWTLAIAATVVLIVPHAFAQETLGQSTESAQTQDGDKTMLVKSTKERNLEAEVERLQLALDQALQRIAALEAQQVKRVGEEKKAEAAKPAAPTIRFSGYIQGQYFNESGEGSKISRFDVRRARFRLDYALAPLASLTLQSEVNDADVELRDAYIDLNLSSARRSKLRLGQFKVPLSYQILESSASRLTPERALINTRSVPGERDRGVVLEFPLQAENKNSPLLQLGLFDGRGINQIAGNGQTSKNYLIALHFPNQPLAGRLAFLGGKYTNDALKKVRVNKTRWMMDMQYDRAPWNVQLQFGGGEGDFPRAGSTVSNTDVRGGYLQVAHQPLGSKFTLLVRYQQYDPDTDKGGNTISGPLLGIVYDATDRVRYMLALERLDDEAKSGKTNLVTLRTQVRY
ncbi:MAG: OprO/OprP family phosphate-selective porin [Abditibacteriales bacterium]|nr:OprO/OprP family phosphate-selective porin [Abditibacteriales bacterium]MDW8367073.1 porin [Abditibacteriales bacterium]